MNQPPKHTPESYRGSWSSGLWEVIQAAYQSCGQMEEVETDCSDESEASLSPIPLHPQTLASAALSSPIPPILPIQSHQPKLSTRLWRCDRDKELRSYWASFICEYETLALTTSWHNLFLLSLCLLDWSCYCSTIHTPHLANLLLDTTMPEL